MKLHLRLLPLGGATLTTAAVTSLTATSAVSGGTITSDGGGSNYQQEEYVGATTQNPTTENSITSDGPGTGSFISTLINLQPETTYFVKAYATNISGTSYGNELTFKTSSVTPSVKADNS